MNPSHKGVFLKLGILGGTFDPIHLGHLRTAEEVGQELSLDKVYLIPSALPPHKNNDPITPFYHRMLMTRIAIGDSPLLEALELEGRRHGFSYSIETLQELHRMFSPEPELFFILGTDAFLEIESWKEYRKLFDYAHFVVIQRAGYRTKRLEPLLMKVRTDAKRKGGRGVYVTSSGKTVTVMASTLMEISSTRIRKTVAEGKSIRFLVPEAVREYIMEKGLYANNAVNR